MCFVCFVCFVFVSLRASLIETTLFGVAKRGHPKRSHLDVLDLHASGKVVDNWVPKGSQVVGRRE